MSDERRAAMVSFAYNLGVEGFCKSSVARRLNENDPKACDGLLNYVYARGVYLPGLAKRRKSERALCMEG
jgi:lysozyme